ncbi:hypothetical protein BDW66DRAFT_160907 [Aspergillus desertorum]
MKAAEKSQDVFAPTASEDMALEHLGYKQELQRSFSLLDMIGFSFSIVTCWTALSGVFIIGVRAGGPPVMGFGWIGVCVVTSTVALSMAEMCSRWPVAGGQYSWVALLAPPQVSRQLSYITGWFMLTGILAMGAVNNSVASNFSSRWHTVLITYAVAFSALLTNIFAPHLLNRLSRTILIWNICSFVVITITLLATNKHKQSAPFVFQDFQNYTGFGQGMATIEMTHPSRDAPKAMIMSVGLGAVTGFVFLLTLCFCIGDIETTAASTTGVPVIQIFYDSTNSKVGACSWLGSRSLFAFARDRGLPFSGMLSKVTSERHIPLNVILATTLVQMAFNSIYFGTVTGFNTIISIATTGFCPFSLPFPLSVFLNAIGLLLLLFAFVTFTFPSEAPVNDENMNYTSAAIGVIALIGLVTWAFTACRRFSGPVEVNGWAASCVGAPSFA